MQSKGFFSSKRKYGQGSAGADRSVLRVPDISYLFDREKYPVVYGTCGRTTDSRTLPLRTCRPETRRSPRRSGRSGGFPFPGCSGRRFGMERNIWEWKARQVSKDLPRAEWFGPAADSPHRFGPSAGNRSRYLPVTLLGVSSGFSVAYFLLSPSRMI